MPQSLGSQSSAQLFFLYILVCAGLTLVSAGAVHIIFYLIGLYFAPVAPPYYPTYPLSSMLVGVPVLVLALKLINSGLHKGKFTLDSSVRGWMTYIILSISGVIAMGDLVRISDGYFSGELGMVKLLELFTVLLVSGLVIGYFVYDIVRPIPTPKAQLYVVNGAMVTLIVGTLVAGFFVLPSPTEMRKTRLDSTLDSTKFDQLKALGFKIERYFKVGEALPQKLQQLVDEQYAYPEDIVDSDLGRPFEYRVTGRKSYKICTTFRLPSKSVPPSWAHKGGYQCYLRSVPRRQD